VLLIPVGVLQEEEKNHDGVPAKGFIWKMAIKTGGSYRSGIGFFQAFVGILCKKCCKKIKGKISMKLCVFIT